MEYAGKIAGEYAARSGTDQIDQEKFMLNWQEYRRQMRGMGARVNLQASQSDNG